MILVTGAGGFVGQKIIKTCEGVIPCPSLRGLSEEEIKGIVCESGADTVIHTAAISDIGKCEADPEASYIANVKLPIAIAKASKGIKLICFSSDQVYGGSEEDGPYTEDMAKPANTYAKHKLEMEQRVLDMSPDAVMLRAHWMYDYYLKKPNYFMNVLNAKDQISFSPLQYRCVTYVREVAENMENVIRLPGGVYNFGSETQSSIYDITKCFLHKLGKNISISEAPKAHNLWTNCEKATKRGVIFSDVQTALIKCAKDYGLII